MGYRRHVYRKTRYAEFVVPPIGMGLATNAIRQMNIRLYQN